MRLWWRTPPGFPGLPQPDSWSTTQAWGTHHPQPHPIMRSCCPGKSQQWARDCGTTPTPTPHTHPSPLVTLGVRRCLHLWPPASKLLGSPPQAEPPGTQADPGSGPGPSLCTVWTLGSYFLSRLGFSSAECAEAGGPHEEGRTHGAFSLPQPRARPGAPVLPPAPFTGRNGMQGTPQSHSHICTHSYSHTRHSDMARFLLTQGC